MTCSLHEHILEKKSWLLHSIYLIPDKYNKRIKDFKNYKMIIFFFFPALYF